MDNKNAIDKIHDQMNPMFNTRNNPNWRSIIEAIGEADQDIADLIQQVREQFFISTAVRPYIDRLGANVNVIRPKIVGMDDPTLRKYIPILAYRPKQVKQIFDQLLDIFFFKEATTAFTESTVSDPFFLKDGWELIYIIDGINEENIIFKNESFSDITNASSSEIVSVINRQAKYSFAVVHQDRVTKRNTIRIFTKTIGSKGSVENIGGRCNISIKLNGYIDGAGSGSSTQWSITKVGDMMTFQYVGGVTINLDMIQIGDIVMVDLPTNTGSFYIENIDLANNSFSYIDLFGNAILFDHGLNPNCFVRFIRPSKNIIWNRTNRACVWEVSPGEIIIEMPSTPPVVRRDLKGSAHLNGLVSTIVSMPSNTSIILDDTTDWPASGQIVLVPKQEIQSHIVTQLEDTYTNLELDGRFDSIDYIFNYSNIVGNTLSGITPPLPMLAQIYELSISTISKVSDLVTITTTIPHNVRVKQNIAIANVSPSLNGPFEVEEIVDEYNFRYRQVGIDEIYTNTGYVTIEVVGLRNDSIVYLTSATIGNRLTGPYCWDTTAVFVLSGYTSKLTNDIKAGTVVLNLPITIPNSIPTEQGYVIFDYGLENQEGPVRYLYKASESLLALDPSYVFQYNHNVGSNIVAIRRKGAQVMSGLGKEMAFYLSDPSSARIILQDLILQIKSVGIFLKFLVRYPEMYYSDLDIYNKTTTPLD